MGLSARWRRLRYVWGWRLRHWWFDTRAGRRAHRALFLAALAAGVGHAIAAVVALTRV